jgi:hypothetical protein
MRRILQVAISLVLCGCAAAPGLAQVQITPTPLNPTPLIAGPNSTACYNSCDIGAMSCQNSCLVVGPLVSPNPAGGAVASTPTINASCTLSCSSQQLVCKQACARSP